MSSRYYSVDPSEIEARYSTEDSILFLEQVLSDYMTDESSEKLEKVKRIMEDLPPREADIVEMYFFLKKTQTDIAEIFRVSQPTICYRLRRATDRIKFSLSLPDVLISDLAHILSGVLKNDKNVQIMLLMFETTCQSEVAKRLGLTQGKVRHRFLRSVQKLKEAKGVEMYAAMFESIANNLNILREVQRDSDLLLRFKVLD